MPEAPGHDGIVPHDHVHVIPTCVDVLSFDLAETSPDEASVAVCVADTTDAGKTSIAARLASLEKSLPSLQLRTVCDRSLNLEHLRMQDRPGRQASVAADIGASWLPDDESHAGKRGRQVLQMMAAGLPVVANPVGVQKPMVRHGETGYLAESPAEWEQALRTLATDAPLRRRLGLAGRRLVESHYHVTVGSNAWLQLLQALEAVPHARAAS